MNSWIILWFIIFMWLFINRRLTFLYCIVVDFDSYKKFRRLMLFLFIRVVIIVWGNVIK